MSIDLGSILQLARQFDQVDLVVGNPCVSVRGVVGILAGDDIAAACQPGDLVIVLDAPPGAGWLMDAFLRRCGDAGVAAVVLPECTVDKGSRSVAERLGLPVLRTRVPWRLSVVIHELLHASVDAQIGALTKALLSAIFWPRSTFCPT
ncbi:MAG: hypothetical protein FWF28_09655, partial [Micrococcales bacterium]|nr:hypothetical protein [Micrococcales bacterium]